MSLTDVLKKYVGQKLFAEEQAEFKQEFFKELFDPYGVVNYKRRSTIFINAVLEEDNLPFIFAVEKETLEGSNYGRMYWLLVEL